MAKSNLDNESRKVRRTPAEWWNAQDVEFQRKVVLYLAILSIGLSVVCFANVILNIVNL